MSERTMCDGCGKEADMVFYPGGQNGWHKPPKWYQRQDGDGIQDACSRECIKAIAEKSGKTDVVIPL